jgi:hypothetical protein
MINLITEGSNGREASREVVGKRGYDSYMTSSDGDGVRLSRVIRW